MKKFIMNNCFYQIFITSNKKEFVKWACLGAVCMIVIKVSFLM